MSDESCKSNVMVSIPEDIYRKLSDALVRVGAVEVFGDDCLNMDGVSLTSQPARSKPWEV